MVAVLSYDEVTAFRKLRRRWIKYGPAKFAIDCLGVPRKWDDEKKTGILPWQWEASWALASPDKGRVSIRSGHGVGKTCFMAWSALWYLICHNPVRIPATAPSSHQLNDVLWSEIARWHSVLKQTNPFLADQIVISNERIYQADNKKGAFAVARTSRRDQPEALQGFHCPNMLFLIDEASGVPDVVFEVAEGALASEGAKVLMCSNPTRKSGFFYDSHHQHRSAWYTIQVNGEECPLVSQSYIERMRKKYGAESTIYKIRVLGEFAESIDGVIPLDLCLDAVNREVEPIDAEPIWGLDVARFGDDSTALAKRQGNVQLEPVKQRYNLDTMQTVGWLTNEYEEAEVKPSVINVDVIGIGAGVVDRAAELGLPVAGVNVAELPSNHNNYMRLRDELWYLCREWLEARDCKLCDDDDLISELPNPTYRVESNGKIKVESKDEMKKRGIASPNCADAWNLTFARTVPKVRRKRGKMTTYYRGSMWG